jgi:hypothetical protein
MLELSSIHTVKRSIGLLVSSVAIVSLLLFSASQPRILGSQIGIACAGLCSMAVFVFCLRTFRMDTVTATVASLSKKLLVIGLPVSGYAIFSIMYYARQQPHLFSSEIGVMCGLICSFWVLIFFGRGGR